MAKMFEALNKMRFNMDYCEERVSVLPFEPEKIITDTARDGSLILVVMDPKGNFFTNVDGKVWRDMSGQNIRETVAPFWMTTFFVSLDDKGNPCSMPCKKPAFYEGVVKSRKIAEQLYNGQLLSIPQWGALCESLVMTGAATRQQVYHDSTLLGNYENNPKCQKKVVDTGTLKEWTINGVAEIAGNLLCVTNYGIFVGGSYKNKGNERPLAYYGGCNKETNDIGIRVVIA